MTLYFQEKHMMQKKVTNPEKYILEITVFFVGAVIMIFEIVGSRVLGPYVGTSVYVWTSLIGVILASLSIGYWLGGHIADRNPSYKTLSLIIFSAAVLIGITTFTKDFILQYLVVIFRDLKWSSFFAALVIFTPTSILLGMVSPYAVRLKMIKIENSGSVVGNLYAISTIGSIAGTFSAGYFLIPFIGTTKILYSTAIILLIISTIHLPKWLVKTKIAVFLMVVFGIYINMQLDHLYQQQGVFEIDTEYNRVWIMPYIDESTQKPALRMRINNENSSAIFINDNELVFEYMKYFRLAKHFQPRIKRAVMFGGAGYAYPNDYLNNSPEARIDVVEIDPELTKLARKYFRLKYDPRMTIYHEDARTFLNRTKISYDAILIDVFKSNYSLPFHLTTKEAVQKNYNILKKDGVIILNLVSAIEGDQGKFLRAQYKTFKSVFPQVYLFTVRYPEDGKKPQNIILVALKSNNKTSFQSSDKELDKYLKHYWKQPVKDDVPILTDDYGPVEYYVSAIFDDFY
jgi:spermidine synthase